MKKNNQIIMVCLLVICSSMLLTISGNSSSNIEFQRISISEAQIEPNNASWSSNISSNGRYIAFYSAADNLVPEVNPAIVDLFVFDFNLNKLTRITKDEGLPWWGELSVSLSSDGRFVAFPTYDDDLILGDTNENLDIYVYDQLNKSYERVSVASDGTEGNGLSQSPVISDDGRYVAFRSTSYTITPGQVYDNNAYLHDRFTHETIFIARNSDTTSISSDGNFIVFNSIKENIVNGDTNNAEDVFVFDRTSGQIERVSVNNVGIQGNNDSISGSISGDGRYVAFVSRASNFIPTTSSIPYNIFVRDRVLGTTKLVSKSITGTFGNDRSYSPEFSEDGNLIVFSSYATNLITEDNNYYCRVDYLENCSDIFLYDMKTESITRVSTTSTGQETNGDSFAPAISRDGEMIVFGTEAFNIIIGDTNSVADIYTIIFPKTEKIYLPILLK